MKKFLYVATTGLYSEADGYETSDFIDISIGAGDAGKPVILNSSGEIDASMLPGGAPYSDEDAQDAVGTILVDSGSVNFTYSDATPSITAVVIEGGVDHNSLANLTSGDPHTQYFTTGRADTWLATKTTADLAENTNLYFTNERAQDAVGSILTDSSSVDFTYDDAGNTISAAVIASGIDHGGLSGLGDDDHTIYHTDARALTWLGTRSTSDLPEGSRLYYTDERVDDRVNALVQDGVGLDWTYDDVGGTLTGNVTLADFNTGDLLEGSNLYFTTERAQDAVGTILTDSGSVDFTYDDVANTITAVVSAAGVDHGGLGGLADDDHTQYHNDGRALTWLGTRSTSDLPEGSRLYYTDERAQDAIGAALTDSSTIDFTYNDGANTITATVIQAGLDHGSIGGLADDDHTQYHTDARALTWLGTRSTTDLPEGTRLYYTDERAQDAIGGALTDTASIDFTYNDAGNTISAAVLPAGVDHNSLANLTVGDPHTQYHTDARALTWLGTRSTSDLPEGTRLYYTDERAQDAVGTILTDTSSIDFTYNDAGNTISAVVLPAGVSHNSLANLTTGDPHTQYHTDARALTWLGTRSTSDLSEGTRLYYTDERVDDRVAVLVQNGTGLTWTYNDVSNTFTGNVSLSSFSTTNLSEGSNLYFTDERAQDAIGTILTDTASIDFTYNDIGNTIAAAVLPAGVDHNSLANLTTGDPHTQYHTDARALTWLGTRSTADLPENTNLYFTTERAQDAVGGALTDTASIDFTYNDAGNTISAAVLPAGVDHNSLANLTTGDPHTQYHTDARALTWLGTRSTSDLSEGTRLYYTDERVDDRVAVLIQNGTGISWSYNDVSNTFTPTVSLSAFSTSNLSEGINLYFTNERAQDAVGTILTDTTSVDFTYDDAGNAISAVVLPAGVDHNSLANLTTGDPHTQYFNTSRANTWLATKSTSDLTEGSNLYYTDERVDDRVATLVQNGTGLSWSYNDAGNTLTGTVSLASFSTSNLSEGSNLYFTDERAQDAVGTILTDTASIDFTYNDAGNTISAAVLPAGVDHNSLANLTTGDPHTQYHTDARATTWLATKTSDNVTEGSTNLYYTTARAALKYNVAGGTVTGVMTLSNSTSSLPGELRIAEATANGSTYIAFKTPASLPLTATYTLPSADALGFLKSDGAGTLTWNSPTTSSISEGSNLYFTDERAQDAVGTILTDSSSVDFTYNDAGNTISAVVLPAGVDHNSLASLTTGDPHTQYHNDARALTWLGTKSTTNLPEGSNLYFTDERAQDAVGTILTDSSTIDFTYTDASNTITATVIQGGLDHGSIGGLADDDHTQYHTDARADTWLATKSLPTLATVRKIVSLGV